MPSLLRILLVAGLIGPLTPGAQGQQVEPFEEPPINYSATPTNDPATAISAKFQSRAMEIRSMPAKKRLQWLLDELGVPVESQIFVFSKTSLQRELINPETPRVLYFSDEAYIGWSPTGAFEVAVFDAKLGATFYVFEPHATKEEPLLARSGDCLLCHSRHEHTPSLRTRSVFPDANGEPLSGSGSSNIAPSTPLAERWGGWYVTGTKAPFEHRGNLTGKKIDDFEGPAAQPTRNLLSLEGVVDTRRYLLKTSDVVPLLMHDHQVHVHNVLSKANQDARIALHRWPAMREILGLPKDAPPQGSCVVVFDSQAAKVLDALLCRDEAAWPAGGIQGDGVFAPAYAKTRKPDAKGRSLRDLDLRTRLFRYRCSPLIYSESFATLPKELHDIILLRLSSGLRAFPPSPSFGHLPDDERTAIHEILSATLPNLPAGWGK
ncbi:MAG: hypothetical protein CAK86_02370 [Opitutia bacterium AMD-G1]|nr:MAG: hypothetical protein CAK86_02370 [Opitutae bacterium AMD-G1]